MGGIMDTSFDWTLCRTFLAVVRCASIATASRQLGLAHPTVRRHLAQLEEIVGTKLFTRSQCGVEPTPAGERLVPHAERMEAAATLIRRGAAWDQAEGTVRIVAGAMLALDVVPQALARVRASHPGLRYHLTVSETLRDLMRRDADIALTTSRPVQENVVASRVADLPMCLAASRKWVEIHGTPSTMAALVGTGSLVIVEGRDDAPCMPLATERLDEASIALRTSDPTSAQAAVVVGVGAGLVPTWLLAERQDLVRLVPDQEAVVSVWLSTHPDLRSVPQVRVTMEALRSRLKVVAKRR